MRSDVTGQIDHSGIGMIDAFGGGKQPPVQGDIEVLHVIAAPSRCRSCPCKVAFAARAATAPEKN